MGRTSSAARGSHSAAWLPLACDPEIHRKHDVAKQYDVAFVGNVFPGPRADLLELIRRRYPNSFVGQCYFEEMARTYSAARIGLQPQHPQRRQHAGLRGASPAARCW